MTLRRAAVTRRPRPGTELDRQRTGRTEALEMSSGACRSSAREATSLSPWRRSIQTRRVCLNPRAQQLQADVFAQGERTRSIDRGTQLTEEERLRPAEVAFGGWASRAPAPVSAS